MGKGGAATGTRFQYWAPKVAHLSLPPETDGEPSPKQLVQQHFKEISSVPFGSMGTLDVAVAIPRWEIVAAALNAGYGSREALAAGAIPMLTKPSELRHYLRQRLEMAYSCIDSAGVTLSARDFFQVVESSEKNAVSFIAGCIGTYIAARRWLKASGTTLTAFLHVGLYTKASAVGPMHYVQMTKMGARVPDFLVQDARGSWHVFESKGGGTSSRWKQVVSGLRQLSSVKAVHQHPQAPASPASLAVVQTRVESGAKLEVTLVDPTRGGEGQDDPQGEGEGGEGGLQLSIELVPGAWQLLRFLETVDWFKALSDEPVDHTVFLSAERWTFAKTRALGGVFIGVPTFWLETAAEIADQMARYFAMATRPHPQALREYALELDLQTTSNHLEAELKAAASEIRQLVFTGDVADQGLTEAGLFIVAPDNTQPSARGGSRA